MASDKTRAARKNLQEWSGPGEGRGKHSFGWMLEWAAIGLCLLVLGGFGYLAVKGFSPASAGDLPDSEDPANDPTPPPLNPYKPTGPAPEGMVWIPGGEFWMGVNPDDFPETDFFFFANAPRHKVYVDGFWMDRTEVTNEEFAKFVAATGYKTVAELPPDPKDFPNLPKEKLAKDPFSICFRPPQPGAFVDLRDHTIWNAPIIGASWKNPDGPESNIQGKEKYPVVHICWEDAMAYGRWAKKRLPTEAEWEFAARGGLDRKKYCWGNEPTPEGKIMANYWQGLFPVKNDESDGFYGAAPVASFPANGYGLHDMAGNVWEWCLDWFREDFYLKSPERNPRGPDSGFDPNEPGIPKRVQRGGSFLCADNYCMRYLPGARGKGEPKSAASHIGFRCVRSP